MDSKTRDMKIRDSFLPFSPPLLGEEEIAEVVDTLRSDWITTGPKTKRFEKEFSKFVGARNALALSSGTGALHTALAALGIGEGDAVVTTVLTFCSGVHVIEQVGAYPILVDVENDTLNIDPNKIEQVIRNQRAERKIKVVLPVHFGGHPCEMDAVLELARKYRFKVVEDAAHALPAKYKDRRIGTIGDLTAFSFYATKNLTTGEGGMLTGTPELVQKARIYSLHGIDRGTWDRYSEKGTWYYEVVTSGYKYNMTDLQAAIGIHQLRRLPEFHGRRTKIAESYHKAFSKLEEVQIPANRPDVEHAWHLYILRLNLERLTISRNQFIEELRIRNIASSVHYVPNHLHPYYREKYGYKPDDFPIANREYQRMLSLPLYPRMSDEDVKDVIDAVYDIVHNFRK